MLEVGSKVRVLNNITTGLYGGMIGVVEEIRQGTYFGKPTGEVALVYIPEYKFKVSFSIYDFEVISK